MQFCFLSLHQTGTVPVIPPPHSHLEMAFGFFELYVLVQVAPRNP